MFLSVGGVEDCVCAFCQYVQFHLAVLREKYHGATRRRMKRGGLLLNVYVPLASENATALQTTFNVFCSKKGTRATEHMDKLDYNIHSKQIQLGNKLSYVVRH